MVYLIPKTKMHFFNFEPVVSEVSAFHLQQQETNKLFMLVVAFKPININ